MAEVDIRPLPSSHGFSFSSPDPQPPKAAFMTIPVELRLEIYSHLLHQTPANPHYSPRSYYTTTTTTSNGASCPINGSLLRTNHQINAEATDFLYGDNTFLAHPSLLTSFPRLSPSATPVSDPAALRRIHRLRLPIRLDCAPAFTADAATIALSGLEQLTVHLLNGSFLGADAGDKAASNVPANLRLLEGVRGVRRLSFCGSTQGHETYLEWLTHAMTSEEGAIVPEFVAPAKEEAADSNIEPKEDENVIKLA
jgi:hypothetical protein